MNPLPKTAILSALIFSILLGHYPTLAYGQADIVTIGVGSSPQGIAYDSGKGEVFVANSGSDTVSVISDTSDTVVANISVGAGASPAGLAYDPAKGEVFVVDGEGSPTVTVISDETNAVVAEIRGAGGYYPTGIVYDSDKGEIFVANHNSTISVISDASDTIVATVYVGHTPVGLAFDPAKGEVFVTNPLSNYTSGKVASGVSVISDVNNSVIAIVNVGGGPNPEGLAYDPVKGEVFVADGNSTSVRVISDTNNSIVANVTLEAESAGDATEAGVLGAAYDSAEGEIFVADGWDYLPNAVSVISDTTNAVVATFDVGYGPVGVAYDSGKGEVFVANSDDNTVSVISDATPVPQFPSAYALPIVFAVAIGMSIRIHALRKRQR
jgi:YVTN family beta-propeller protein